MKIGYARVSTKEQHLDMQLEALKAAGCEKIFSEKMTGRQQNRPELDACLSFLREGDTLVVYKLDRLGRSLKNILTLLEDCKIGKVDGRNPVCPGFRLRGSFLAVTPKKNQKNASRTIGCDIVKYAKTWLFRINTYLRAKGDRNECIFYF